MTLQTETATAKAPKPKPLPKPFKIECDRVAMVEAINLIGGAIDRTSTLPITGHILFRAGGRAYAHEIVEATATDLCVYASHRFACWGSTKGQTFTLPFAGLAKSLSQLDGGRVSIEIEPKELKATIISDGVMLTLDTLPPEDFPAPREFTAENKYTVRALDLHRIIHNVRLAISTEEMRYYLHGAYFHCVQDGVLRVVATDGHRLVLDELPADVEKATFKPLIVPSLALHLAAKHCKDPAGTWVAIESGADGVSFDFGLGQVIRTRTIDGSFPDYARVIPEGNDKLVLIDNAALDKALAKFPKPKGKDPRGVKLAFLNNRLTLSTAVMKQHLTCQYDGPAFDIGFNLSYLRDALSVLDDTVGFAFSDPGSPALVMSGEWPRIVLMPLRVV